MNDTEFIAKESAKLDKLWLNALERIEKFGFLRSKVKLETMLIAGWIVLSPPRPGFIYNHHKLTEEGILQLRTLGAKYGVAA